MRNEYQISSDQMINMAEKRIEREDPISWEVYQHSKTVVHSSNGNGIEMLITGPNGEAEELGMTFWSEEKDKLGRPIRVGQCTTDSKILLNLHNRSL